MRNPMGEENTKSTMVAAGKLQSTIRGIRSLPQARRIAIESKEGQ